MDISVLQQTLFNNKETYTYLVFESGAQPLEDFRIFHSQHAPCMHSLYLHPQLAEFQEYGPWLLEVKNQAQLSGHLEVLAGVVGIIVAHRHLSSVAIQLSRGCTLVGPDNHTSLVRFYAPHVLNVLALSSESDWHAFLFRDIAQWWIPGNDKWEPIPLSDSTSRLPANPVIRLNEATWQKIADKPEISSVLAQWQTMPSSQHFSPCVQRDMVIKALRKAKHAGITEGADSKLYALCYLNGGKALLASLAAGGSLEEAFKDVPSLANRLSRGQITDD
ncbi:DUF4123 domain-containing protein [Citrobacter sp. JGM124]|uniref:DUF4123 domain-containing protein n=1 Tax=Citrobacter sp. JGM124 TaxID=2799789 RepID=UPI001BA89812|nr:DUF4123 domain-containing protein [Citrobacter sp. JGM124]MBS0848932.1 DUF4123 domain-containing protein [Citrobacter sp. JGM124]